MITFAYIAGFLTGALFVHWRWRRWYVNRFVQWERGAMEIEKDCELNGEGNVKSYKC